jgi:hypothetical protein
MFFAFWREYREILVENPLTKVRDLEYYGGQAFGYVVKQDIGLEVIPKGKTSQFDTLSRSCPR